MLWFKAAVVGTCISRAYTIIYHGAERIYQTSNQRASISTK